MLVFRWFMMCSHLVFKNMYWHKLCIFVLIKNQFQGIKLFVSWHWLTMLGLKSRFLLHFINILRKILKINKKQSRINVIFCQILIFTVIYSVRFKNIRQIKRILSFIKVVQIEKRKSVFSDWCQFFFYVYEFRHLTQLKHFF